MAGLAGDSPGIGGRESNLLVGLATARGCVTAATRITIAAASVGLSVKFGIGRESHFRVQSSPFVCASVITILRIC